MKFAALATALDHENMEVEELSIEEIEIEDDEFTPFVVGNKIKVLIQDVDKIRWKQELSEDEELLVKLLNEAQEIGPAQDAKLLHLKEVIREKANSPINPNNRKIIIFTAFADTARYLYQNIVRWAKDSSGI